MVLVILLVVPGLRLTLSSWVHGTVIKTGLLTPKPEKTGIFLQEEDYQMIVENEMGEVSSLHIWKDKVLFVNFWATWCAPCLAEMPEIDKLYQLSREANIQFLMISTDQDWDKAKTYIRNKQYSFPIYRLKSSVPSVFYAKTIPATYVIAAGGELRLKKFGMASYYNEDFIDFLKSLYTSELKNS